MTVKIERSRIESNEKFELDIGDIIETVSGAYLVVCDGHGSYQFISIDGLYTLTDSKGNIVSKAGTRTYKRGDILSVVDTYKNLTIKEVYKKDDVLISIKY